MDMDSYRVLFSAIGAAGVLAGGLVALIKMVWTMGQRQAEQSAKVETVRRQVSRNGGGTATVGDAAVRLERGLDRVEKRFDNIEQWAEHMDARVDEIDQRMRSSSCGRDT